MYLMTKRLLMLFFSILLPVFLFACGSGNPSTTSSTFITGFSAVRSDSSTVRTWGANGFGQLGNGSTSDSHIPVKVVNLTNNITAIATGGGHMLALDSTLGTVWAWGYNANGQLGNAATANSATPVNVVPSVGAAPFSGVTAIAAGSQHSLAIAGDKTVWAWGYNGLGQLGNMTISNSSVPVQVKKSDGSILPNIIAIAAGGDFSLALDGNGVVWAWGNNAKGQLGVSSATPTSPGAVQVNGLPFITKIAAGGAHGLALDLSGAVWGWGYNAFGQLGQPVDNTNPIIFPVKQITALTVAAKEISAGSAHSLALSNDGSVYSWGYNFYGQLGNNLPLKSETPLTDPRQVEDQSKSPLTNIVSIAAIGFQNVAIDGIGNVWTWGYNGYGQLGDGTTTDRSFAQKISFP